MNKVNEEYEEALKVLQDIKEQISQAIASLGRVDKEIDEIVYIDQEATLHKGQSVWINSNPSRFDTLTEKKNEIKTRLVELRKQYDEAIKEVRKHVEVEL